MAYDTNLSSLKIEDIIAAKKKLDNHHALIDRDLSLSMGRPQSLFGINLIEVPTYTVPKLKLSKDAPVSDDFRKEFDAWLLERFGVRDECPVPEGVAYLFQNTLLARFDMVCKLINIG